MISTNQSVLHFRVPVNVSEVLVSEGVSCGRAILLSVVSRGSSLMLLRENCGGLNYSLTIYFNLYMVLIMSGIVKIRA